MEQFKININSKELRDEVKKLIDSQVKAIVRESIEGIIKEVVISKYANVDVKVKTETLIQKEINSLFSRYNYNSDSLESYARKKIDAKIIEMITNRLEIKYKNGNN